ncbi:phosphatase PAP2 family protein [Paenibacillus sacheonensis]|uniref:Phosphatase PAP2 family protein n=1 Tax=Paenibacillus sacheonensis TaxID=742054 RepID=A0A7X4YLZ9_9BACL|nr:phosphatase PAP2 family protein [Paenibacillus sacheonensis]MBM7563746.1 membrane-associated phospholipid phosphatase [Paenibacillus sacheonensis]NBC67899.1 phosphatase PAP2 family protein [Paenibacillus sacheonensis]
MTLFDNMTTVAIYTTLTVIILIWYGTKANPFKIGGLFIKELIVDRKYALLFFSLILILLCNKFEMRIEKHITKTYDFSRFFQSIEGSFVANVQHTFQADWLTTFLSFMYIVVLQALIIASVGIYTYLNPNKVMFRAICFAIMFNYLIAIPFFLFLPVSEVWHQDPNVSFLMLKVFPDFENQYRALSGLDNCFPSLHTSISVTIAILAVRSGIKRWAWLCCISAVIIIFSIFYLGIHWLIDMCGGLALGTFASLMGIRLSTVKWSLRGRRGTVVPPAPVSYLREDAK